MRPAAHSAARFLAAAALVASVAACASGPGESISAVRSAAPRDAKLAPPEVDTIRSFMDVAMPFPEGDWEYVGDIVDDSLPNSPQHRAVWASAENGVLDRLVVVWRQSRQAEDSYPPFPGCDDHDYPHAVVYRNAPDDQACWHVRPVSLGLAGDAPVLNRIVAAYAERRDLVWPAAMVGVRYLATDGRTRRSIEYLYNTDLLAPTPDRRIWRPSDWTRTRVAADPRRRAVVSALREWGERWATAALPTVGS